MRPGSLFWGTMTLGLAGCTNRITENEKGVTNEPIHYSLGGDYGSFAVAVGGFIRASLCFSPHRSTGIARLRAAAMPGPRVFLDARILGLER